MAIEALDLGEEPALGKVAVEDADGVVCVDRRDEPVPGVVDGLEVPGDDEAGGPCTTQHPRARIEEGGLIA